MVHKVMMFEAAERRGKGRAGLVPWLRRHRSQVAALPEFRKAAVELVRLPMTVLTPGAALSVEAADVSREAGLLTNDATSVALMRRHGLSDLASNDDDFAGVGGVGGVTLWRPR